MSYRGCVIAQDFNDNPLTQSDFDNFKRWNMNACYFNFFWDRIEQTETGYFVYNETRLGNIETGIQLAETNGFKTYIAVRVNYGAPYYQEGWANALPYQVLLDSDMYRNRYWHLLQYLMNRFPKTGIAIPSFFPFHSQSTVGYREWFYFDLLPDLMTRALASNAAEILVVPIFQGAGNRLVSGQYNHPDVPKTWNEWVKPEWLNDPRVHFNTNSHDGGSNIGGVYRSYNDVVQGDAWDGSIEWLQQNYQPIIDFKTATGAKIFCNEAFNLNIHGAGGPDTNVNPTRLAWVQESMKIQNEQLQSDWFYYHYRKNPSEWGDPRLSTGQDSQLSAVLAEMSLTFPCSCCSATFNSQAELDSHKASDPIHQCASGYAYNWNTCQCEQITPPPPPKTYAARVPMMPTLALVALKKLRDRFIRKEVHEKVHPVI